MVIYTELIQCQKIKIISTGPNWDYYSEYLSFKRIELLSNDPKYSRGVFSTLVSQSENHDPHKCPVLLHASRFSLNKFHLIDTSTYISTLNRENSYFQIEFAQGTVILNGDNKYKMKSYKIMFSLLSSA